MQLNAELSPNEHIMLKKNKTNYRLLVLGLLFLVYAVNHADRTNIGAVLPFISEEFQLTKFQAGALASMFFLGYAIIQVPAGFLMRKYGTRGIISFSIVGFSTFTALIGFAGSAFQVLLYRFGLGLSEGPTPVGLTSTINNWFPAKEKATATGVYIASTMFAPIFVPPLVVWISVSYSWHWVFYIFAIPGFFLAVVWYFLVASKPEQSRFVNKEELEYIQQDSGKTSSGTGSNIIKGAQFTLLDKLIRVKKIERLTTGKQIFSSKNIWCSCLAYFMMVSILYGILTWIPSYLLEERQFSFIKMGFVSAMPFVGGFIGSISGGWISDNIFGRRRKPTMIFTALTTVIMMVVLINIPNNTFLVALSLFLVGLMLNIGWPAFTAYPMGVTDQNSYPIAIALVNSGGNMGGFVSPMVAGLLLDKIGGFGAVFTYFGICALVGLILILLLDEPQ